LVVTREPTTVDRLRDQPIAVPGTLTTAFLALSLCIGKDFRHVVVPFDRILDAVRDGSYQGQPVGSGLVIHEGQLTYARQRLHLVVDLGVWWLGRTGLPLPLGANGIRKDLGEPAIGDVNRLLRESIDFGLAHRPEALAYAARFGRDLDDARTDTFVGMYVNEWTRAFGARGREAVGELLRLGFEAGILPKRVSAEFVGE